MTVENWMLAASLFGNLIFLYQWRDSVITANNALKKEIMESALATKETVYATQENLRFYLQEFGARLEPRRIQALERAQAGMDEHCKGLLVIHNNMAATKKPKRADLEDLSARVRVLRSEANDMAALLSEARRHHERA